MSPVGSIPRRRLSSRRGSQSAPDPYAHNVEVETAEAKASRITILPVKPTPTTAQGQHGSPGSARDRSSWGSQHSASSTGSPGTGRGRLSFAFSSFTPINSDKSNSAHPPPSSPRFQRSSSSNSLDRMSTGDLRTRTLTPQEVCDMAYSAVTSPGATEAPESTPFLLLDEEEYLPFLDRPAEVTSLLSSPPTNKLMALLHQTFPVQLRAPSSPLQSPTEPSKVADFGEEPEKWSYADLLRWLQTVDRNQANDRLWISKARRCVLKRSELIWERMKAALGVPPELEEDEEEYDDEEERMAEYEYTDLDRGAWLEPIYNDDRGATCVASPLGSPMPHGDHMESIGEGAEDENVEFNEPSSSGTATAETELARTIQGLRLSAPMMEVIHSPRSVQNSPTVGPVRRALSSAAAPDDAVAQRRRSALAAAAGASGRVKRSAQQERGTGDPLFPSSFATLTMGPSLVANNPALRSGPRRSFRPGVPITGRRNGRFYCGSMSGGWDTDGNDYAISLGSGSERSFRL